ncbi:MAG: hypothetical protein AAGB22_08915 [Bacteroidota bacterium]
MKAFLRKLLFFCLPFLAGLPLLYLLPYDKEFAYQYQNNVDCNTAWIYDRIFQNEQPVDVAFIGTSHTGCGVNDSLIQKQLRGDLSIANLAYCREGRNLQYAVLKDLLKTKRPRLLVIEVQEEEKHHGHPEFAYMADAPDILNPVMVYNKKLFSDWGLATRARFDYHRRRWTGDEKVYQRKGYGADHNHDPLFVIADSARMHNHRQRQTNRYVNRQPVPEDDLATRFPRKYLEKMLDLCQDHGVAVTFLYLPEYGSTLPAPLQQRYFEARGQLWIPPQAVLDNPQFWADPQHLNYFGAKGLSLWLSQQLEQAELPENRQ